MKSQLTHDPRSKQIIKDALVDYLYSPVKDHYINRLKEIIDRNSSLRGNAQEYFRYRGEIYKVKENIKLPRQINTLHDSLKPEMDEYIADLQKLNDREYPYVYSFISQALSATNSFEDLFDIFPESTHKPLQDLVNTCPCNTHHLSPTSIQDIKIQNTHGIELIKRRMFQNLLL